MKQQYGKSASGELEKNKKQAVIKSKTAAHSTTVTMPLQSPVPVNKSQSQHSSRQLTPRPPSHSAKPVTRPESFPIIYESNYYNIQLTPRPTCLSETSADTNLKSKRPHHSALPNSNIARSKKESHSLIMSTEIDLPPPFYLVLHPVR